MVVSDTSQPLESGAADGPQRDATPGDSWNVDTAVDSSRSPGLIAHYRFDGDATDEINGYDGDPTPSVSYDPVEMKSIQSVFLDGLTSYIKLPYALSSNLTRDFSMVFWVMTDQDPALVGGSDYSNDCDTPLWIYGNGIIDAETCGDIQKDWGIALMMDGRLGMYWKCSSTSISDGEWHEVALTRKRSPGTFKLYIDKYLELEMSNNEDEDFIDTLEIGVGNNSCDKKWDRRWFKGHIDELRLWNRVLTPAEILALDP